MSLNTNEKWLNRKCLSESESEAHAIYSFVCGWRMSNNGSIHKVLFYSVFPKWPHLVRIGNQSIYAFLERTVEFCCYLAKTRTSVISHISLITQLYFDYDCKFVIFCIFTNVPHIENEKKNKQEIIWRLT